MLTKGVEAAMNDQIAREFYAAHLYLSMSAWLEEQNLPGFAHWMRIQSEEERGHAMRLYQFLIEAGARLTEKSGDRLLVSGPVRIIVDAFDRTNMNASRRRLGLYKLGYQILKTDGTPVSGFEEPRINILFDRLPGDREATKVAYAAESGITVYGSAATRFLYEVTNTVRDGRAEPGVWDPTQLPKGDYVLRIIAADYSGNEAQERRDVLISIK